MMQRDSVSFSDLCILKCITYSYLFSSFVCLFLSVSFVCPSIIVNFIGIRLKNNGTRDPKTSTNLGNEREKSQTEQGKSNKFHSDEYDGDG